MEHPILWLSLLSLGALEPAPRGLEGKWTTKLAKSLTNLPVLFLFRLGRRGGIDGGWRQRTWGPFTALALHEGAAWPPSLF